MHLHALAGLLDRHHDDQARSFERCPSCVSQSMQQRLAVEVAGHADASAGRRVRQ
jgi:hypothetical protein